MRKYLRSKTKVKRHQIRFFKKMVRQNWLFLFSCKPNQTSFPTKAQKNELYDWYRPHSQLIYGLIQHFNTKYDKETLKFQIPKQLSTLESVVPGAEIVKSNTIIPLQIFYSNNIVQESIAYIFVNTECNGLVYEGALEKGNVASKIFNEILHFKEVSTFTNLNRQKVIEKLEALYSYSRSFAAEIN